MVELEVEPYKPPRSLYIDKNLIHTPPPPKWEPKVGELAQLIVPVMVFRDFGNDMFDVHDDEGTCINVSTKALHKPFIHSLNAVSIMTQQKDAVLAVAKRLAKANNTVTTLEIKTELRRDYPYYYWTQQAVSDYMAQFAGDGIFTYTDNGTYRIYSLASPTSVAATAGPVSTKVSSKLIGISKVAGKVASKTPAPAVKRGRGRPRKNTGLAIARGTILMYDVDSLVVDGKTVTKADIRAQKKSLAGYLTASKLAKVTAITVKGVTHPVA